MTEEMRVTNSASIIAPRIIEKFFIQFTTHIKYGIILGSFCAVVNKCVSNKSDYYCSLCFDCRILS